jgi:nitrate/nitrite transport system ATP-binding protein
MLLLDKPFGALDALTRGVIEDELLRIRAKLYQMVFMIMHDVDEAILLADRILLMSDGPRARIAEIIVNTMPRDRVRETIHHDPRFYRIRKHLVDFLVHVSKRIRESEVASQGASTVRTPVVVRPGLVEEDAGASSDGKPSKSPPLTSLPDTCFQPT